MSGSREVALNNMEQDLVSIMYLIICLRQEHVWTFFGLSVGCEIAVR